MRVSNPQFVHTTENSATVIIVFNLQSITSPPQCGQFFSLIILSLPQPFFQPIQLLCLISFNQLRAVMQHRHLLQHNLQICYFFCYLRPVFPAPRMLAQLLLQFGHFLHYHQGLCFCTICGKSQAVYLCFVHCKYLQIGLIGIINCLSPSFTESVLPFLSDIIITSNFLGAIVSFVDTMPSTNMRIILHLR
nr:MAG TPA: hypothetical protein [Caudoviricetes sp.]DAT54150.1 MAG TPA: hypothetical protein [Caudoviricetes sp.]